MALIECPDCGKEISDKAPSCPNCGRPMQDEPDKFNPDGTIKEPEHNTSKKNKSGTVHGENEGCFLKTMNVGCLIVLIILGLSIIGFMRMCST